MDPLVVLFYFPVERIAPLHANTCFRRIVGTSWNV